MILLLALLLGSVPGPVHAQGSDDYPLAGRGPHAVGTRVFKLKDASRNDRAVNIMVWYPALLPADAANEVSVRDAEADLSSAPYPLILASAKIGNIFGSHVASHGFVMAGVTGQDSSAKWGDWLIDYPLDLVFVLNQIAAGSLDELADAINAEQAGAMGYSFDGYTSLALSGARVDPDFYLRTCADVETMETPPSAWWVAYTCALVPEWEAFAAHAGEAIVTSDDGLWQPLTDPRILAAMPMAPEGAWLFGERGLAAVNRPTLIIGATADNINYYGLEAVTIFERLGTPDRILISFVGQDHMMVLGRETQARMKHFATAFFGYYLAGRADYYEYFSEAFVAQHDDLAWGVVEECVPYCTP
jgi:predicted dienelactone hydrolase